MPQLVEPRTFDTFATELQGDTGSFLANIEEDDFYEFENWFAPYSNGAAIFNGAFFPAHRLQKLRAYFLRIHSFSTPSLYRVTILPLPTRDYIHDSPFEPSCLVSNHLRVQMLDHVKTSFFRTKVRSA